jgi:hypothetical protein
MFSVFLFGRSGLPPEGVEGLSLPTRRAYQALFFVSTIISRRSKLFFPGTSSYGTAKQDSDCKWQLIAVAMSVLLAFLIL